MGKKTKNLRKMKSTIKKGKTVKNGESVKSVSREILLERLNRFYACRDFELSHLWQRSVFLGAFLILTFTGYGYLLFAEGKDSRILEHSSVCAFHLIALGLAFAGSVISILWIMMGKGSKAWYEVYESRICDIETRKEMGIEENYRMGFYGSEVKAIDDSLFSYRGGKYSLSKINIAIGLLSLILWFCIGTFHLWSLITKMSVNVLNFLHSVLLVFFFMFVIAEILKKILKSTNL